MSRVTQRRREECEKMAIPKIENPVTKKKRIRTTVKIWPDPCERDRC
jgi:hypothetical protein